VVQNGPNGGRIDPALLEQIEEVLITADIGMKTTQRILERLRDRMSRRELTDDERVWAALRDEARDILAKRGIPVDYMRIKAFPFTKEVESFMASHSTIFVSGRSLRSTRPTPVSVPPVP